MRMIDGDELVMWLSKWMTSSFGQEPTEETEAIRKVCDAVGGMVKELERENKDGDLISRQAAIDAVPSAEAKQRYTEEELRVFAHGISLSLLSKRSAQHWRYDKDTATEIEFLERLYDKVSADMKGRQG